MGGIVGTSIAAALTEAFGWIVADDFYRMSQGEAPENIIENVGNLKGAFDGLNRQQKDVELPKKKKLWHRK